MASHTFGFLTSLHFTIGLLIATAVLLFIAVVGSCALTRATRTLPAPPRAERRN
jgi:hypothetical protein